MAMTLLVSVVAPRTGRIIKIYVFEKEKICFKIVYTTLCQSSEIMLQLKLEFTQAKN